jgi:glycosyltransferase involved in cell wall biosynthesis
MSRVKVSVIIPSFNRETLIGETVANLLAQSVPPDEIIVVDDGSTDGSVEVVRSFGGKVKLIQQANQGPGAARNAGLRIATGEFIQFQDSDDLYSLNKLEVQAKLLEQSGADIAFSPWVKLKIEGRQVTLEDHVLQQQMPPAKVSLPCWWLRRWSTVFQSLLFRRSFLDGLGFYRTDIILGEDGELFFRALTRFPKVAFTAEALTLYRLHQVNKITQDEGSSRSRRVIDWARCLRCLMERYEDCGLRLDPLTRLIFFSEVNKHLGYLRVAPGAPAELVDYLSQRADQVPAARLPAVQWGVRLAEQVRLRWRGSRWTPAFQAGPLTTHQRSLIQELGFEIK